MLEIMKNAEALAQLDFPGKMLGSIMVTLLGIGVTFCVLLVILLSVKLMPSQKAASPSPQEPSGPPAPAGDAQAAIPPEVVAAITAAIYALEPSKRLFIQNITPCPHSPAWTAEGRGEAFSSRRMLRK